MRAMGMKMRKKTGQLKIQQTAFMLIFITLFFALVGLFFLSVSYRNIQTRFYDIQAENAKQIVSKLAAQPEFTCGVQCIDMDKALIMKDREVYRGFWQAESIIIRRIYPMHNGSDIECTRGSFPECNILTVYARDSRAKGLTPDASNFVRLCRKEVIGGNPYEKCDIGLVSVSFIKKESR
jgi:hypothetical protein